MIRIARRIVYLFLIIMGAVFIVHLLVYIIPGDPAIMLAGEYADGGDIARIREELSLNDSFWIRYFAYVSRLISLDMGNSVYSGLPVLDIILDRLPNTLLLACMAMVIAGFLGIIAGIFAALHKGKLMDSIILSISSVFVSTPIFVTCFLLTLVFSYYFNLLPPSGMSGMNPAHFILPSCALASRSIALIVRITRNELIKVMNSDYIRTVQAMGFPQYRIVFVFALKNIIVPVLTIILLDFGAYLGGAVVTESVFSWPGIGKLLIVAVGKRDIPVIQGVILFGTFIFIALGFLIELFQGLIIKQND
ncbi:MAG: ABC transporter permease [Spirochaetes bacterium]|nr:ABC transporter permease [Spirochaetota bacterium]